MKALEKDRTRRFESASGLALDVERFLKNEPIEARPPSGLYRFQKWVRRNKTAFAAAAAVVAALVLGFGLSLYLFVQERHALRSEKEALHRAVAAEHRQAELRDQAEKGLALERQLREMAPMTEKFTTAGRLMSQGQFEKAEEMMSDIPLNIPQSSVIYNSLGRVYGSRSNWPAAIRNFTRSITADPTNYFAYPYLGPLLVQTGDVGAYRNLCERALNQFGETADPTTAEQIAKYCMMLPPPANSLKRLAKMADIALAAGPTDPSPAHNELVKGLAEYRQGHFAGALEWLRKAAAQEGAPARTAQADATLAMTDCQLGQTNAAREELAQGIKIAETELAKPGRIDWNDGLIAQFLLREAQGLITGTPAPAADGK
jgi:tetratricopeptide (TPR) repeat protein